MTTSHDYISDRHSIMLLTIRFDAERNDDLKPLNLKNFNILARRIASSAVSRPSKLLELSESEIGEQLEIDEKSAKLIAGLLSRKHSLAIELSNLEEKGIRAISRAEPEYPSKLLDKLKHLAPPLIFYAGDLSILNNKAISIVGSRRTSQSLLDQAHLLGEKCAQSGVTVVSGAAKGVDMYAMMGSLQNGGLAAGIVADSLKSFIIKDEISRFVRDGRLVLLSAFPPWEKFTVWRAMDRNKYIYSLSDFGIVVRSDLEKGGTWSGATECIEKNYCALFVLDLGKEERGNAKLINMRGIPLDIDMISREPDIYRLLSGMIERDSEEEPFIGQNVKQLPLWF
ncbi:hypothetical protein BG32_03405 [Mesotoga sp. HF07.pep.5.2.highcov]|nr:hypothetical protein V513_03670 [Mesotoga sp. H07.pep.5.3]RLL91735.1 hypothetical protein BG32_03405 [Mesotoga sp. HF07.pep.5.2.highcov]